MGLLALPIKLEKLLKPTNIQYTMNYMFKYRLYLPIDKERNLQVLKTDNVSKIL